MEEAPIATVPVSRTKALTRAVLWCVPACVLGGSTWLLYERLEFSASALSNRLVDYCIALMGLPLAGGFIACLLAALRRFLLALWPMRLGIVASRNELVLRLGPMGTKRFGSSGLEIRYPFELEDDEGGGFEALLPEDQQVATILPRMRHAAYQTPINRIILAFAEGTERDVVTMLRPAIEQWRASAPLAWTALEEHDRCDASRQR